MDPKRGPSGEDPREKAHRAAAPGAASRTPPTHSTRCARCITLRTLPTHRVYHGLGVRLVQEEEPQLRLVLQ